MPRLQVCLQQMSGSGSGSETGDDAWLLLDTLTGNDEQDHQLIKRFEHSGRVIAEQGSRLDVRLGALQEYTDLLIVEWKKLLQESPQLLVEITSRFYQLHGQSSLALTRGYQSAIDQQALDTQRVTNRLEHRLMALQRINGVSNSAMDLDQTLEVTAQVVADELNVELCAIFFYDEMQRVLTLRATNGPRPLG